MKFTLSWLKMHLDTDASLEAVAEKLTMIGLEVEKIEDRAKTLAPFTVARVLSAEKHPNADKLKVCMVETGEGAPVQVVCGAPNARAGMMAVFARPGAHIPGSGMELRSPRCAGSRAAACWSRAARWEFPRIIKALSSCRPTRRWASRSPP